VNILDVAHIFYVCPDILDRREYLMGANISLARTFHGREHFMGANISWAQTFHGREYFRGANIFDVSECFGVCADISRCAHIFEWKRIF
jgi:hypothetical protein